MVATLIDLQKYCEDYLRDYDGRMVSLTIKYKTFDTIYVRFDIAQLPHLLGLHKIYKAPAKKIVNGIQSGRITYEKLRSNSKFGLIKQRLEYFPHINDVFMNGVVTNLILVSPADNMNSMNLDIVFSIDGVHRKMRLGLRKIHDSVYAPVTFFVVRSRQIDYQHSKRVGFSIDQWLK